MDWSYDLLSEPEKELFRRFSVFSGGFTLETAEGVGTVGTEDVLDLLGRLVEQSLVTVKRTPRGGVRYGMLEPVRQYALERLEQSAEAEDVLQRHALFFRRSPSGRSRG